MDSSPQPKWKAKHAWAEVDRTGPPKRPAEQRVGDFHEIYSLYDEARLRCWLPAGQSYS
jgi:glutamate synthase (NADPH/NADH) small chain